MNKDSIKITTDLSSIKIRDAKPEDVHIIFSFIQKKAEFERQVAAFSGELQVNPEKLRKTLFGARPFSQVLFAESAGTPIGFALYAFHYSSFAGQPSLWLDDLYVDEDQRSRGAGAALMHRLFQVARENDCTHLAWTADARNKRGLEFYSRLSAKIIEQKDYRCLLSWDCLG